MKLVRRKKTLGKKRRRRRGSTPGVVMRQKKPRRSPLTEETFKEFMTKFLTQFMTPEEIKLKKLEDDVRKSIASPNPARNIKLSRDKLNREIKKQKFSGNTSATQEQGAITRNLMGAATGNTFGTRVK